MLCFKLPAWVIQKIDRIIRDFLWGKGSRNTRGMSLLNWNGCCLSKSNGGLGISNLALQNIALLIRWWWRLYQNEGELWFQIMSTLRRKRIAACNLHDSGSPRIWNSTGSFFWMILQKLKLLFLMSSSWLIGDGARISFWFDAWDSKPIVKQNKNYRPPPSLYCHSKKPTHCYKPLLPKSH